MWESQEVGEYRRTQKFKKDQISDFLKGRKIRKEYIWSNEIIPINENEYLLMSKGSEVNKNLTSKRKRHTKV